MIWSCVYIPSHYAWYYYILLSRWVESGLITIECSLSLKLEVGLSDPSGVLACFRFSRRRYRRLSLLHSRCPLGFHPSQLIRIAKAVYPHWRERRIERGGGQIMLILNNRSPQRMIYMFSMPRDQSGPASQVTLSDKPPRLQPKLLSSQDLTKNVLDREMKQLIRLRKYGRSNSFLLN